MENEEIWKDIAGFEGYYQVSNLGRVRSLLDNHYKPRITIKATRIDNCGYEEIHLAKNANSKYYTVHRLVAKAFVPNPEGLPFVNHKDENKQNNKAENLEWCTRKYNNTYGTARQRSAETAKRNGKRRKAVMQFDKSGKFIAEYDSPLTAAEKINGSYQSIVNCC